MIMETLQKDTPSCWGIVAGQRRAPTLESELLAPPGSSHNSEARGLWLNVPSTEDPPSCQHLDFYIYRERGENIAHEHVSNMSTQPVRITLREHLAGTLPDWAGRASGYLPGLPSLDSQPRPSRERQA